RVFLVLVPSIADLLLSRGSAIAMSYLLPGAALGGMKAVADGGCALALAWFIRRVTPRARTPHRERTPTALSSSPVLALTAAVLLFREGMALPLVPSNLAVLGDAMEHLERAAGALPALFGIISSVLAVLLVAALVFGRPRPGRTWVVFARIILSLGALRLMTLLGVWLRTVAPMQWGTTMGLLTFLALCVSTAAGLLEYGLLMFFLTHAER
ncbi:MAG: hypothetical protein J7M38_01675, partial [Armatimonadetes bacterium]|nr:hypothetical protein [Armatimonadota bacterium]